MEINWSEIDMKKVGNRLAFIRESKGLTQDQFIEGCNIQYRQYSKYENGLQKPIVNEENFFKLLSKHKIDVEWLISNDELLEERVSFYLEIRTKNGVEILNIRDKPLEFLDKVKKYIELTIN
jgi:transcriptional regulator with XRE-family HTH domain